MCVCRKCTHIQRGRQSKGMWPAVIVCTFCFLTNITNTRGSPGETTRQKQSSPIIELTTYCYVVLQKQLSPVSWYKAMHIHMQVLSHSIKVVMAALCCENDCISIGMTLWVHRAVLCMLMQAVKTDLRFRGGPPGAITLHWVRTRLCVPGHARHFYGLFHIKNIFLGLHRDKPVKMWSLLL